MSAPVEEVVNPARAGMILLLEILEEIKEGKPRASGDDPKMGDHEIAQPP